MKYKDPNVTSSQLCKIETRINLLNSCETEREQIRIKLHSNWVLDYIQLQTRVYEILKLDVKGGKTNNQVAVKLKLKPQTLATTEPNSTKDRTFFPKFERLGENQRRRSRRKYQWIGRAEAPSEGYNHC